MTYSYEMIKHESLTSFPRDFINSTSSGLKLAMDIDFTLCGGVKPRLEKNVMSFRPLNIHITEHGCQEKDSTCLSTLNR